MGNLILRGRDADDVFSYDTPKVVRIRDRRLGLLHLCCTACVWLYIAWSVWFWQLHLTHTTHMIGTTRLRLVSTRVPTDGDALVRVTDSPYCRATNASAALHAPVPGAAKSYYCQILDAADRWRPEGEGVALIVTFESEYMQERACARRAPECPVAPYTTLQADEHFVADVERSALRLDHTVVAPSADGGHALFAASNRQMTGHLWGPADGTGTRRVLKTFARARARGTAAAVLPDEIPVPLLLRAAGVDLDAPSDFPKNRHNATHRQLGLVLHLTIAYANTRPNDVRGARLPEPEYSLFVSHVLHTKYATHSVERIPRGHLAIADAGYTGSGEEEALLRTLVVRAGIRVVVSQQLSIAEFSAPNLLLYLASAIGLLSAATTFVDFVAFSCMRERAEYTFFRYELSPDFSDVRDGLVALDREAVRHTHALVTDATRSPHSPSSGSSSASSPGASASAAAAAALNVVSPPRRRRRR